MGRVRFARTAFWGTLGWGLTQPLLFAQPPSGDPQAASRLTIILVTVIAAPLLGLLLYQVSQRSSQVAFKEKGVPDTERPPSPPSADLAPLVLKELARLPLPSQHREEVARSVADIITRTVDERVQVVRKETDRQYGQVIEEQRKLNTSLQHKYQDALLVRKQTASVLESIAEGLVVVNNKGEVVMMNPAAEKLLAVQQKEQVGKSLVGDIKEGQLVSLVEGSSENREIVLSAKQDSTKRILRASNAVITDEDGKTVGMVSVLSDITRQRELDDLKSEFVSKVSHELRTPLIAMKHALSILGEEVAGPLADEQRKFVSLTQRNLERLNTLINDLLDLSKLEAKKTELHLEPTAMASVVQTVCDSLEAWAQSKAIVISRRCPAELPKVTCDPAKITQVLTNLIGNAIKFTPQQGRIAVEAKLAGGQAIEVGVTDTGVGIAKEDLPKLFNKFQQVGERSATDISGTGLGLAIAKEIIELHQGRIWAESDEAKPGARFAFTLPLEPRDGQPQGA